MKNISNNVKKSIYLKNYIDNELQTKKTITLKKEILNNKHIIKHLETWFKITTNDNVYYKFTEL
tara:strand:+ start:2250 stop:2441 length:192 start_codon:yes stop_codon:yes gene_type:complete